MRLSCILCLLQMSLPVWPGRLPPGLTQLAVSPLRESTWFWDSGLRITGCSNFLRMHLPELRSLRHLALHSLQEIGNTFLPEVCTTVAGALPQLVSLHLVRMPICGFTSPALTRRYVHPAEGAARSCNGTPRPIMGAQL